MEVSTTPEQAVPSPEDRLARLLGAEDEPQEPVEDEDAEPDEGTQEAEESEPEQEAQEATPTDEEVEFEGKVYKVPPEIKGALLRQKDYTQKTQEVAEQRRVVEERTKFLDQMEQLRSAQFESVVALQTLDSQLKQYEALNWDELARTDQAEFLRLDRAQRALQGQREQLREQLRQAAAEQQSKVDEFRRETLRKGAEELQRDIKGWNADLARQVTEHAKSYRFSDEELSQVTDPRFVKVLHDAYQWRKLQDSKPGIEKRVANAKPVKVQSRSAPQAQRDSRTVEARQALKKSGRADAAEAFFESLFKRK